MSYFATAKDLKLDGLFLAGEPIDGSSQYDGACYEWLTVVHRAILSGGQFGPSALEPVDWLWARAWPRGALQLTQPVNQARTLQLTVGTGDRFATVVPMLPDPIDLAGWRIQQDATPARQMVMVSQQDPTNNQSLVTLMEPWTGANMTTGDWVAYPDTYELPTDFVRGTSPLYINAFPAFGLPYVIDVIETSDLDRYYPQIWPMGAGRSTGGLPIVAARVSETKVRFSHYLNTPDTPYPVQVEFDYIKRPDILGEGSIPPMPDHHRRVLSYGLAYLILADKDDGTAQLLWSQFQAQLKAMMDEYRRTLRRMSTRWGTVQPSRVTASWGPPLWTSGGLPVWNW